jgi:hypothetical protein
MSKEERKRSKEKLAESEHSDPEKEERRLNRGRKFEKEERGVSRRRKRELGEGEGGKKNEAKEEWRKGELG